MRKQAFVLVGLASAAITANTQAAFIEAVITDLTVDGTWQTAVISVSGLTARLEAISGVPGALMVFQTGDGSGLFNHDSYSLFGGAVTFDGEAPFASANFDGQGEINSQYDSGVLSPFGGLDTSISPGFAGEITSFSFSSGLSDSSSNIAVFDLDLDTAVFGPSVEVFRVTWSRLTTLDIAFQVSQTGTAFDEYLEITLPAIPAPGAFALLGLAGLVGLPRRRRG